MEPTISEFTEWAKKNYRSYNDQVVLKNAIDLFTKSKEQQKEWEIFRFIGIRGYAGQIFELKEDGLYYCDLWTSFKVEGMQLEDILKENENVLIYSVRRLSDKEIFTIGDIFTYGGTDEYKIETFFIDKDGEMIVSSIKDDWGVEALIDDTLKKIPQPLMKTVDGVDAYEGQDVWQVTSDFKLHATKMRPEIVPAPMWFKYFSTEFIAKEYIFYNKQCFSLNDIKEICSKVKFRFTSEAIIEEAYRKMK